MFTTQTLTFEQRKNLDRAKRLVQEYKHLHNELRNLDLCSVCIYKPLAQTDNPCKTCTIYRQVNYKPTEVPYG